SRSQREARAECMTVVHAPSKRRSCGTRAKQTLHASAMSASPRRNDVHSSSGSNSSTDTTGTRLMKRVFSSITLMASTAILGALFSGGALAADANEAAVKPLLQQDLTGI